MEPFGGMPVLVIRNDHDRRLFNGDVGVILTDKSGSRRAVFTAGGGFNVYQADSLPRHEPAFAMTVHKAQGSEYDQVLLALPDRADHRLLSRRIVYTALTRARLLVVIFGKAEILEKAISREIVRESGLSVWGKE